MATRRLSVTINFKLFQPDDMSLSLVAADIDVALQTGLTEVGINAVENYDPEQIAVVVEES